MRLGMLAALDQRIGVRYQMAPMTPGETGAYLRHHTKLAGRADTLFSDDAAGLIHQASRGYPRAASRLAAAALLAPYTTHTTLADPPATPAAPPHARHPYAYIDGEDAITPLDPRQLTCSSSEAAVLRIAASLGDN